MTPKERDEQIEQIKADPVMPLPLKAKAIERVMAEFRVGEHGDGRLAEERSRYDAYDSAPSNLG